MGIAGRILMHGQQTWDAAAFDVFTAHRMAGAFGGYHNHVNIFSRNNQIKMHIQTMGKSKRRSRTDISGNILLIDIGL